MMLRMMLAHRRQVVRRSRLGLLRPMRGLCCVLATSSGALAIRWLGAVYEVRDNRLCTPRRDSLPWI